METHRQFDLFEPPVTQTEAEELRDRGINQAVKHADEVHDGKWSDLAFEFLLKFIQECSPFMGEELRLAAMSHDIPLPPSDRAWGGVIVRAAKRGLIRRIGFKNTSSPNSHCTPATLWERA